jgi:hypothetical protein
VVVADCWDNRWVPITLARGDGALIRHSLVARISTVSPERGRRCRW